jgi:hypothetical protein
MAVLLSYMRMRAIGFNIDLWFYSYRLGSVSRYILIINYNIVIKIEFLVTKLKTTGNK